MNTVVSAKIIADSYHNIPSVDNSGNLIILDSRITTFELEYPRFIHSELMTHRSFSRNSASSRAIPVEKVLQLVAESPAMPLRFGINKPGMQSTEWADEKTQKAAEAAWLEARDYASACVKIMQELKIHKQFSNRLLEPFQTMKVVVTSTDFENWFDLRAHPDAQPEIRCLAEKMQNLYLGNRPVYFKNKYCWHLPYYNEIGAYLDDQGNTSDVYAEELDEARKISASLCAQVSYRSRNDTIDKAIEIYNKLVSMRPMHASPFEHQACPLKSPVTQAWTHYDRKGNYWSGNFQSWEQYRQILVQDI